jgi:hypothetical protein
VKQGRDLGVDVLDRLLLALVRLKDFQKLLVDLWLVLETVLGKSATAWKRRLSRWMARERCKKNGTCK